MHVFSHRLLFAALAFPCCCALVHSRIGNEGRFRNIASTATLRKSLVSNMNKKKDDSAYRIVAENRVARRNYEITDTIEAGLELRGTEVKSVRNGRVNLRDGFASIDDAGEIWLRNVHIAEHQSTGGYFNHKPKRPRKLLMHKKEIRKLKQLIMEKGVTLVPLRIYFNKRSWLKVLVGVGKGKKLYDKREAIKRRDTDRMVSRAIRAGMRGEG